jgi:hypothetical protein
MGRIFSVQRGMRKIFNYLVHFINPGLDGTIILKWVYGNSMWKQNRLLHGSLEVHMKVSIEEADFGAT